MTTVRDKTETGEPDMSGDHEHRGRGRFRFYPYQADKADKAGKAGILEKTTHARERIASPHDTHAMPDMQVSCRGLRGEQLIFEFEL